MQTGKTSVYVQIPMGFGRFFMKIWFSNMTNIHTLSQQSCVRGLKDLLITKVTKLFLHYTGDVINSYTGFMVYFVSF